MEGGASSEEEMRTAAPTEAPEAGLPGPDAIDRAIATFLLFCGLGFLVVSTVAMVLFFRERNSFEIRARSAYLSMLNGLCYIAGFTIIVVRQLPETFLDVEINIYAVFTGYFFFAVCNAFCYGSRTIRLAMLYNPRARKAAPWLLSERNHVIVCLLLGATATAVPLYDMTQVSDGPLAERDFYLLVLDHYWIATFASQSLVLLLNPIAWLVDDLFGVGPELRAMMIVQLVSSLTGRLAEEYAAPDLFRWISLQKMGFITCVVMIPITVILPIKRRLLHPLQSSDPNVVNALARRRAMGGEKSAVSTKRTSRLRSTSSASGWTVSTDDEDDDGSFFSSSMLSASVSKPPSAGSSTRSWTYERVMKVPEVAGVFERFVRKALCYESFLFLKDVTTYQAELVDDTKNHVQGGNGNADETSKERHSGSNVEESEEHFTSFAKIVHDYIVDGSPNEINISWKDKNDILDVYKNESQGELGFRDLPASERRLVFARAYAEIRFMLESNLMLRFISTTEFDKALTAAQQKQETVDTEDGGHVV